MLTRKKSLRKLHVRKRRMNKHISVGKILNFHGIKGEAKVGFSDWEFFSSLDEVFIKDKPVKIAGVRRNKNFAIVKFEGIDSIDELLEYKGSLLFAPEQLRKDALDEDEFLIGDLVGLKVTGGGVVVGVSNNGATDLLSVKTNSGKVCLVPFVKDIVREVNLKDKTVTINNIEGLLE